MKAIVVDDQETGLSGMQLVDRPVPEAGINEVVVQVFAAGFVRDEMEWPPTWIDRRGLIRSPTIPGHELAGVVTSVGYGTTGLSIGQRVFGLADWYRDGSLAEYIAIEARNLAPLPEDIEFSVGASLPISGLTAWQGLFQHGRIKAGQRILVHGAAGAVGTMVSQLALEAGAHVIGTGRAVDRMKALHYGCHEFIDLDNEILEGIDVVDLVFDVIGGEIGARSANLIRPGGVFVSVVGPQSSLPQNIEVIDFVVEADRSQLVELANRIRDGRLLANIGRVITLENAAADLNMHHRISGKTIIHIRC